MCYPVSPSLRLLGCSVLSQPLRQRCLHLSSHILIRGLHSVCANKVKKGKELKPLDWKSPFPPNYICSVSCQPISRFQAVQRVKTDHRRQKFTLNMKFQTPSAGCPPRACLSSGNPFARWSEELLRAVVALMTRLGDGPGHVGLRSTVGHCGVPWGAVGHHRTLQSIMMQECRSARPALVPSWVPLKTPLGRPQVLLKVLPEVLATCPRRQ